MFVVHLFQTDPDSPTN